MEYDFFMNNPDRVFPKTRHFQFRIGERRLLLLIGDFIASNLALWITLYYWGNSERFLGFSLEFLQKRTPLWFYFLPIIWILLMIELYDVHRAGDWRKTLGGVGMAVIIGSVFYLVVYFYYVDPPTSLLPRRGVTSFLISTALLTLVWRYIYIHIFVSARFVRRVLLVGSGEAGEILLNAYRELPVRSFKIVGIIDDNHRKLGDTIEGVQVIGQSEQLLKIVTEQDITEIIVAIHGELDSQLFQNLISALEHGVVITSMRMAYEEIMNRVPIRSLESDWILRSFVDEARVGSFYDLTKRFLDLLGGIVGLLLMLVTLPFVGLAIILDDGWPIFYAQERSGRGGQPYAIIKFRTMTRDAEPDGKPRWAKLDDRRATRVGRILRRTHLDELPQFINVILGDMSLVGPRAERPELVELFEKHIPFYRARLLVKPGITGWAQVNYGYASTIEETMTKLEYDLYYIKRRSLFLDILILLRTPFTVLGLRGR